MHFVCSWPGKLSTKTPSSLVHKEWQARARAGDLVRGSVHLLETAVPLREIDQKPCATCKDPPLHSSRFDSAFQFFFLWPTGIPGRLVFLYFIRIRVVDRFDFRGTVTARECENRRYELTSGTMQYARPTNASSNNRPKSSNVGGGTDMDNVWAVRMLPRRVAYSAPTFRYPTYKCRESWSDKSRFLLWPT